MVSLIPCGGMGLSQMFHMMTDHKCRFGFESVKLTFSYFNCFSRYVSFGSESDGGYMDMSKDEPSVYVPMQEQIDTIKYADIQPSPYESPYQQDLYQEQGLG